ncbi:V-type ATP synthase subunit D [Thiohalophilus sp.]|uniref:V-type ATP synthase subunit D n=1 Tax=Thiohalophilus sp. TaxID=3028392 RepID=UPI002ACD4648|nr:V-type ATP synthase subunit D [Thiohalophilus sp.]MDZ7804274.1 V-type ATP synthase subunit D [Thiohalophilus sp.]
MPARFKVAPTKNNLLQLQQQVRFLDKGYSLLERKRELLTRLVYERLANYRKLRKQSKALLKQAYHSLAITHMRMGRAQFKQTTLGIQPAIELQILPMSSLGVQYLSVSAKKRPFQPLGLFGTDASFDQTRQLMTELALVLVQLGEAETALRRLLVEQRKTQKRVNALKYNVIPRYQDTIRYIESTLEEEERTTLFQIQLLQNKQHQS